MARRIGLEPLTYVASQSLGQTTYSMTIVVDTLDIPSQYIMQDIKNPCPQNLRITTSILHTPVQTSLGALPWICDMASNVIANSYIANSCLLVLETRSCPSALLFPHIRSQQHSWYLNACVCVLRAYRAYMQVCNHHAMYQTNSSSESLSPRTSVLMPGGHVPPL